VTGHGGLRRFVQQQAPPPGSAAGAGTALQVPSAQAPPPVPSFREGAAAAPVREGAARDRPEETCEMCGTGILATHGHVVDLERSSLLCTCRPCYLLFTHTQAGRGRYRAVPGRYLSDPERPMSAAEWEDLQIPVGLAFFLRSSADGQVAGFYPSPAGVTECRLDLGCWGRIAAAHPLLVAAEADVEAILIHRDGRLVEHFVVPVDACYELAGRLRLLWHGFDGGTEARDAIAQFLELARSRAQALVLEPEP
jgi:Family of unknown function (DUF5947)